MRESGANTRELIALLGRVPRSALPAVIAAAAARLAEPEPESPEPPPEPSRNGPGERLLTAEEAAVRLGLDVAAVGRRRFPFRVKLGRRTVRYSEAGLVRWLKETG